MGNEKLVYVFKDRNKVDFISLQIGGKSVVVTDVTGDNLESDSHGELINNYGSIQFSDENFIVISKYNKYKDELKYLTMPMMYILSDGSLYEMNNSKPFSTDGSICSIIYSSASSEKCNKLAKELNNIEISKQNLIKDLTSSFYQKSRVALDYLRGCNESNESKVDLSSIADLGFKIVVDNPEDLEDAVAQVMNSKNNSNEYEVNMSNYLLDELGFNHDSNSEKFDNASPSNVKQFVEGFYPNYSSKEYKNISSGWKFLHSIMVDYMIDNGVDSNEFVPSSCLDVRVLSRLYSIIADSSSIFPAKYASVAYSLFGVFDIDCRTKSLLFSVNLAELNPEDYALLICSFMVASFLTVEDLPKISNEQVQDYYDSLSEGDVEHCLKILNQLY